MLEKRKVKEDTIELIANQIYDKITKMINDKRKRLGIKGGANIRAGGAGPTTPTLVGPKVVPLMVKLLYFERLGWPNNF